MADENVYTFLSTYISTLRPLLEIEFRSILLNDMKIDGEDLNSEHDNWVSRVADVHGSVLPAQSSKHVVLGLDEPIHFGIYFYIERRAMALPYHTLTELNSEHNPVVLELQFLELVETYHISPVQ